MSGQCSLRTRVLTLENGNVSHSVFELLQPSRQRASLWRDELTSEDVVVDARYSTRQGCLEAVWCFETPRCPLFHFTGRHGDEGRVASTQTIAVNHGALAYADRPGRGTSLQHHERVAPA